MTSNEFCDTLYIGTVRIFPEKQHASSKASGNKGNLGGKAKTSGLWRGELPLSFVRAQSARSAYSESQVYKSCVV